MKKLYAFFFSVFILSSSIFSQKTELLIPYLVGEKYGLADESGKIVLKPEFEQVYPFFTTHQLTLAVLQSRPILINRKGKHVMDASPDYIAKTTITSLDDIYTGKPESVGIDSYCMIDSCANFQIYNPSNNYLLFDMLGDLYSVRAKNKVFLINAKGKSKTSEYDRIRHVYAGEIEYAVTEDYTTKKSGLLDKNGKLLLECVYDDISYAGKGTFDLTQSGKIYPYKTAYNDKYIPKDLPKMESFKNRIISRKEGKTGLFDSSKNVLIPFVYTKLYAMSADVYLFRKNDSVGILKLGEGVLYQCAVQQNMNKMGKDQYYLPYVPYTGNLAFINNGINWALINSEGKVVMDQIDGIFIDFQRVANHVAGIDINGKLGLISDLGNKILDFEYDTVFCLADNGSFIVCKGKEWTWLSSDGKIIFGNFDDFKYVLNHYLFVKKENRWYFVDDKGKAFCN